MDPNIIKVISERRSQLAMVKQSLNDANYEQSNPEGLFYLHRLLEDELVRLKKVHPDEYVAAKLKS